MDQSETTTCEVIMNYKPLVRETLDCWQPGVAFDNGVETVACWATWFVAPSRMEAEREATRLCGTDMAHGEYDPLHADFDASCNETTPSAIDDFVTDFGEPEVEVMPGLANMFGQDAATQAAMGRGDQYIGGLRAKFEFGGLTIWTPAHHQTTIAAQVAAIAAFMALDEMLGDRRPELATVRFSDGEYGTVRIEVTRGPEIRVYEADAWLAEVVKEILS